MHGSHISIRGRKLHVRHTQRLELRQKLLEQRASQTVAAGLLEHRLVTSPSGMIELGKRRMLEARAASEILGVAESNKFFFGLPDGGLKFMLEHPDTPFRSRYTKLERVPYSGVVSPNAAHTGANLERDLETVLDLVKPTLVLAPSVLDAHPDHRATGLFAQRILERRGESSLLRYWIIHGGLEWPLPKGWHTDLPLAPPPRGYNLPWQRVSLSPTQIAIKVRATRAYSSQVLALGRFLAAFSRTNELLSTQTRTTRWTLSNAPEDFFAVQPIQHQPTRENVPERVRPTARHTT